ncbi:MAG: TetR/AcrR family transcriptional regulator [Chloroflexota bacterium]
MGRPELTIERRNQILDAFERCIIEQGLSKTSVTKVAKAAKVNRGIIHHYIGDFNDLLSALMERFIENYREGFQAHFSGQNPQPDIDALLDYFFDEWPGQTPNDEIILDALIAETAHDARLRSLCLEAYSTLENGIADVLKRFYPKASEEACQAVAYAIMTMAYGSSVMINFGFARKRILAARMLATTLIQTLQTGTEN